MDITSLGHASFRIRGKTATVITDPYDPTLVGMKFPKHVEADIVTVSHEHADHSSVREVEGNPFIIKGSGEHDDQKGTVRGRNTIYRIEIDGVAIVHLGDLGHTLSTTEIDELDGVNILMTPVGGVYSLDPAQAVAVVNEIEPEIVIPMHYGRPELNQKAFGGLSPLSAFLKEIGKEAVPQPKLTVTRDKLPAEMQVIVLE